MEDSRLAPDIALDLRGGGSVERIVAELFRDGGALRRTPGTPLHGDVNDVRSAGTDGDRPVERADRDAAPVRGVRREVDLDLCTVAEVDDQLVGRQGLPASVSGDPVSLVGPDPRVL